MGGSAGTAEEYFRYRLGIERDEWMGFRKPATPRPPLGHLFAYLLASNSIVPMQVPAALSGPKSRRLTT